MHKGSKSNNNLSDKGGAPYHIELITAYDSNQNKIPIPHCNNCVHLHGNCSVYMTCYESDTSALMLQRLARTLRVCLRSLLEGSAFSLTGDSCEVPGDMLPLELRCPCHPSGPPQVLQLPGKSHPGHGNLMLAIRRALPPDLLQFEITGVEDGVSDIPEPSELRGGDACARVTVYREGEVAVWEEGTKRLDDGAVHGKERNKNVAADSSDDDGDDDEEVKDEPDDRDATAAVVGESDCPIGEMKGRNWTSFILLAMIGL
eukprot:gene3375-4184_t